MFGVIIGWLVVSAVGMALGGKITVPYLGALVSYGLLLAASTGVYLLLSRIRRQHPQYEAQLYQPQPTQRQLSRHGESGAPTPESFA